MCKKWLRRFFWLTLSLLAVMMWGLWLLLWQRLLTMTPPWEFGGGMAYVAEGYIILIALEAAVVGTLIWCGREDWLERHGF